MDHVMNIANFTGNSICYEYTYYLERTNEKNQKFIAKQIKLLQISSMQYKNSCFQSTNVDPFR